MRHIQNNKVLMENWGCNSDRDLTIKCHDGIQKMIIKPYLCTLIFEV